jgi:hypothetical protein
MDSSEDSVAYKLTSAFSHTAFVKSLKLETNSVDEWSEERSTDLTISVLNVRNEKVVVTFHNVFGVEYRSGRYTETVLLALDVVDMTDSQWSGVRYKVFSEDEESRLFFYCGEIGDIEIAGNKASS